MDSNEALHNQSQTQKSRSQAGRTGVSESAGPYLQTEQRMEEEAAARREADEKIRAMADELDRLRRQ